MSSQEISKSSKRKRGPTYRAARNRALKLFDQDRTVTETYKILQEEFPAEEIPGDVRQVYTWQKDYAHDGVIQDGITANLMMKEETSTDTESKPYVSESEPESVAQYDKRLRRPPSLRDKELAKPPSLTELISSFIDSGVPKAKQLAPELLANWEIAFREDDYVQARTYEKAATMLREIPGIPYKKALGLGKFEAKLEYFEIDGLKQGQETLDLINIYKRYRPWEGKENQKAYQKMFNWWFEKTKPLRDKLRAEAESSMRNWLNTTPSTDEGK
jgi:hypothetical protein